MARGSEAKKELTAKILEAFSAAFVCEDGKTIRIPMVENGEVIEIKVALTAAKDVVGQALQTAPTFVNATVTKPSGFGTPVSEVPFEPDSLEPTEEEKQMVAKFMSAVKLS